MTHHVELDTLVLGNGSHGTRDEGVCVMEAVAWWAGERHTDRPKCASKILTDFAMGLNDSWGDEQRQKLVPFIPRIVGTRDDGYDDERGRMAADWLIRTYTPTWLRLAGLTSEAVRIAALPALTDWSVLADYMQALEEGSKSAAAAGDAAWDAARAAAGAAAWDAAGAAARAAAGDAAWDAARAAAGAAAWDAAGDAARDAARAAAGAAAWDAARDAAGAALRPTVEELQSSALELLDRMVSIGVTERENASA